MLPWIQSRPSLPDTPVGSRDTIPRHRVIRATVGLVQKHCPSAWKKVKQEFLADEKQRRILVRELKKGLGADK